MAIVVLPTPDRTGIVQKPRGFACRKPLGALLSWGLACLAWTSCATAPLPSPGWQEAPPDFIALASSTGPLRAGSARVGLDAPFAAPMAGYVGASWFRLRELRDPLFARALVLEQGPVRIALVALDRVLVPPSLRPLVEARVEVQRLQLSGWILAATHTHTAPGGHLEAWPAELFGMGSHDPLLLDFLVDRTVEAIVTAAAALAPVELARGRARLPPEHEDTVSFNRRDPQAPADPWLDVLRFSSAADPGEASPPTVVARIVRFAAHPTLIPFYLRRQSGDFPGILCRGLEANSGGTTLFACGPLADLAAGAREDSAAHGWERRMERIGRRLAMAIRQLESGLTIDARGSTTLAVASARTQLPPRLPWRVPFVGREIASHYPTGALLQALRLGDAIVLSFPGEMSSELGEKIRQEVLRRTSAREVLLWTLADHYLGYAFSRESLEKGGKSQHLSAYGPELGSLLIERMATVAQRCWEAESSTPGEEKQGI